MNKVRNLVKENLSFILFVFLLFSFRSSLADWYDVPSGSMEPGIVVGDRIVVDKTAYTLEFPFTDVVITKTGNIERGDIVIIDSSAADMRLVKRVVGVEGDTVSLSNNKLSINGSHARLSQENENATILTESINGHQRQIQLLPIPAQLRSFNPVTVPKGHVLVMGDNRNNSVDSRYYGFIPVEEIQGRAFAVAFSLNKDNHYLPRKERFFSDLL